MAADKPRRTQPPGTAVTMERHRGIVDAQNALVGDRHPVGVAAQKLDHPGRTAEGLLGIHHPVMDIQLVLQLTPSRVGQRGVLAQP